MYQKDYHRILSNEIMFPSDGTGYKNIILRKYSLKEKENLEYSCIQKDETIIKVDSEYIWVWVATIVLESKEILGMSISKEQQICLYTEHFYLISSINMVDSQFPQMEVHGIRLKPVVS